MTKDEALKLALEALETAMHPWEKEAAIAAIKEALAQPEQEPVATIAVRWHEPVGKVAFVLEVNLPVGIHKVYATSPQPEPVIDKSAAIRIATSLGWEPKRTWVGLTDEEIEQTLQEIGFYKQTTCNVARAIEAKLKEKNT